jgi:DNA-binding transcriptional LysR family regulator
VELTEAGERLLQAARDAIGRFDAVPGLVRTEAADAVADTPLKITTEAVWLADRAAAGGVVAELAGTVTGPIMSTRRR